MAGSSEAEPAFSVIASIAAWNYKHLANVNKERLILSANLLEGYSKQFRMATPMEVMYEEE